MDITFAMATFGEWIRETREAKGWRAADCARRAKMLEPVWSNWENDRSRRNDGLPTQPRPETIRKIAIGLQVTDEEAFRAAGYGADNETREPVVDGAEPKDYNRRIGGLSPRQQQLVDEMINEFEEGRR